VANSQKPKLLITDLDGTILQSMKVAWEYLNNLSIKKKKGALQPYETYDSVFSFYRDVGRRFWLRTLRLLPRMRRYMYMHYTRIEAYPGAVKELEKLQKAGVRIAIVTDNDDEFAIACLTNNHLSDLSNIEIWSKDQGDKTKILYKLVKKYKDHDIFFASHDFKDFWIMNYVALANRVKVTKIFTPNEIDKRSMVKIHKQFSKISEVIL
jgi:FMN phosphatase YigB (HAD superfamily)